MRQRVPPLAELVRFHLESRLVAQQTCKEFPTRAHDADQLPEVGPVEQVARDPGRRRICSPEDVSDRFGDELLPVAPASSKTVRTSRLSRSSISRTRSRSWPRVRWTTHSKNSPDTEVFALTGREATTSKDGGKLDRAPSYGEHCDPPTGAHSVSGVSPVRQPR